MTYDGCSARGPGQRFRRRDLAYRSTQLSRSLKRAVPTRTLASAGPRTDLVTEETRWNVPRFLGRQGFDWLPA